MNLNNEQDFARLREAVEHSREKLRPFRENRLEAIRQYVGAHYGNNGSPVEVPVNYLELAISIYVQMLVGAPPRAYTAARDPALRPGAAHLKLALDEMIEATRLETTLQHWVMDAMFCVGIVEIGVSEASPGELGNWWNGVGEPFCLAIDLDDYVCDMSAKADRGMAFEGHRYTMPLEKARENESFIPAVRKQLKRTHKQTTTENGDVKAETIGSGLEVEEDEYEDEVELWQMWLPRSRQVVTYAASDTITQPLRIVDWTGPPEGPYRRLGFSHVPSNLMPLPPVAIWRDLHDLSNELYLKIGRQALRQKTVLPVRGGTPEDIERVRDSNDGDIFRVDGEVPREVSFGGPNQVNLALFLANNELFNRHSGNVESLGGLSAGADTLGQDELMNANASERLVFMRRRLGMGVDSILTGYAHYLYTDPLVSLDLHRPIGKSGLSVPAPWNADTRHGNPARFKIAIEPYSMIHRSPQGQIKQLMDIWDRIIMPAASLLPPQNLVAATERLLRMIADHADLPELDELIPYLMISPEQMQQQGSGEGGAGAGKPANTTRNYVRKSVPGGSRQQKENALAQALLGQMPQPAESAAMMR